MAFSYSGNPASSSLDALRFLTGDTQAALALLQDAEMTYLLTTYGAAQAAAPYALEAMLAACASDTMVSADGITRALDERRAALTARLTLLRTQQRLGALAPFVGGISVAERDRRREDAALLQPAMRREQFDTRHGDGGDDDALWRP